MEFPAPQGDHLRGQKKIIFIFENSYSINFRYGGKKNAIYTQWEIIFILVIFELFHLKGVDEKEID